jgi:hypothetical protein
LIASEVGFNEPMNRWADEPIHAHCPADPETISINSFVMRAWRARL